MTVFDSTIYALACDRVHRLLIGSPLAEKPVDVDAWRHRLAAAIAQAVDDEETAMRQSLQGHDRPADPGVEFRKQTRAESHAMLDASRVIAVFVEVDNALGLMAQGDQPMTREERDALIQAARTLPTRD